MMLCLIGGAKSTRLRSIIRAVAKSVTTTNAGHWPSSTTRAGASPFGISSSSSAAMESMFSGGPLRCLASVDESAGLRRNIKCRSSRGRDFVAVSHHHLDLCTNSKWTVTLSNLPTCSSLLCVRAPCLFPGSSRWVLIAVHGVLDELQRPHWRKRAIH